MDPETTDNYIPQPGDKVKWWKARKNDGTAKGEVDYVDMETHEAYCLVSFKANTRASRVRCKKRFDQLILLERPKEFDSDLQRVYPSRQHPSIS